MELNDSIFFEQNRTFSSSLVPDSETHVLSFVPIHFVAVHVVPIDFVHLPGPDSGNNVFPKLQPPEPDVNSTQVFSNTFQFNLCGVPGVCNPNAQSLCLNTKLGDCQACDDGASVCFIFLILCLGLAILIGNALILFATAQMRKKKTANIVHWYKASLAVADLLTGNCCKQTINACVNENSFPTESNTKYCMQ